MPPAPAWNVVVPVKGAPRGKSRLARPDRLDLARAFAMDTVDAVLAVPGVRCWVVTSDLEVGPYAVSAGARALADPGAGLNAAVAAGVAAAVQAAVDCGIAPESTASHRPAVAALLADLPALTPSDLRRALAVCREAGRAFVPDRSGLGTVLVAATDAHLVPLFGQGSAARHAAAGYRRLDLDLARLRTDVDVRSDLSAALSLGCGRHTAAVLASGAPFT